MVKHSTDNNLKYFLVFPEYRIAPEETICMKCQSLWSGKNKQNINLSSAEIAQRAVTVKLVCLKSTQQVCGNIMPDLYSMSHYPEDK